MSIRRADVRILPAEPRDVDWIAAHARQADRDELWAAGRYTAQDALDFGLRHSTQAWAGFIGQDAVCMFGVVPSCLVGGVGVPWMIGTDAIERHQFAFLRHCRPCVGQMRVLYDTLVNWVDDRNAVAQRWLRWLGFHVEPPEPYGPDGLPFRRFSWRR